MTGARKDIDTRETQPRPRSTWPESMVTRSITFGRGPGCDVVLTGDEYMSPVHCRITEVEGLLFIEDCGSTNGTWVTSWCGTRRVFGPEHLHAGDLVRIGRTVLPWSG